MRFSGNVIFAGALFCVNSDAFIPRSKHQRPSFSQTTQGNPTLSPFQPSGQVDDVSLVALFAKKKKGANAKSAALDALDLLDDELDAPLSKKEQKALEKKKKKEEAAAKAAAEREASQPPRAKGKANAKAAALDALDLLDDDLDAPLSKKEQKALEKKKKKEEAAANAAAERDAAAGPAKPMSKKEKMLQKALELEMMDAAAAAAQPEEDDKPKLSKKELKALKKKEEKMAAKQKKKAEKKAERLAAEEAEAAPAEAAAAPEAPAKKVKPTLEDKIRKERPPPRIRVMESAQPGFVSLRMENIGITFRNQEVLKDVTWGVQSGERIGLVGKNGAGKSTQLRIMSGELEPTTGDVVKSSGDLRTAMLRQEFVDELVKERTLKEEFMSVFAEENQIVQDLKEAETQLETMSDADPDAMQEILDRMADLQQKAEDKDVYVLESKVKKTMDLMGFNDDEADDLVASFSGGWKMRIGLGKVLLKDPNVLLLGKSSIFVAVF